MNLKSLKSEEFLLYDTIENCLIKGKIIKTLLRKFYTEKQIEGYACLLIENEDDALNEDIEVETNQQYPFYWVNITYDIESFDRKILNRLKKKFNLKLYQGKKQSY